jgi:ABC-2 type transport system permease protein
MSTVSAPAGALPAVPFRPGRPSFAGAVASELLKLRRQALTWVLLAGVVLITALAQGIFLFSAGSRDALRQSPSAFYFTYLTTVQQVFAITVGTFLLIASARLVSMEYGSGTIRIVLARGTGRLALLGSQLLALALAGLVLLAVSAAVGAAVLLGAVAAWHGSLAPITSLPAVAWRDTWINVLMALLSIGVCVLLGTAAAVVGRSVAFGVGVAMAFFPADNFGTLVLALIFRLTHQDLWPKLSMYLLGPNLNQLPAALQADHVLRRGFATPLQPVDATHGWAVVAVYAFVFLAAAVGLTWRRDVLH